MGIRFWCPNGHKLNVKTFQAGRRGICPYCGARFQIPTQSTRKPGMQDLLSEPREHSVHEGAGGLPPAAAPTSAAAPAAGPIGPIFSASSAVDPATPAETAGAPRTQAVIPLDDEPDVDLAGRSARPPGGGSAQPAAGPKPLYQSALGVPPLSPATAPADPLAEAPDVVWYVRPPTGGQFGPATADLMRNWLDEGRVSPDSLVWREGWRDWQEAAGVFPQLGAGEPLFGSGSFATKPAGLSAEPAPHAERSKTINVMIITVLVLAVIILFFVFLYVAFGGHDSAADRSTGRVNTPVSLVQRLSPQPGCPNA